MAMGDYIKKKYCDKYWDEKLFSTNNKSTEISNRYTLIKKLHFTIIIFPMTCMLFSLLSTSIESVLGEKDDVLCMLKQFFNWLKLTILILDKTMFFVISIELKVFKFDKRELLLHVRENLESSWITFAAAKSFF